VTNLSLCSGAGTLDLAVEQITGNKTLVYAENDPFASRVMEARFPWAVNAGDITTADWAGIAHPVADRNTVGRIPVPQHQQRRTQGRNQWQVVVGLEKRRSSCGRHSTALRLPGKRGGAQVARPQRRRRRPGRARVWHPVDLSTSS
jgi:hypothetical protein